MLVSKSSSSDPTVARYDGHGNNVAMLQRNGSGYTVGERRSYDAWGAVRQGATTGNSSGRYVANLGHSQDDESRLVYMRARYYELTSESNWLDTAALNGQLEDNT